MNLKQITTTLIVSTFAIWIAWDVYLARNGGPTESMIMRDAGKVSTFVPHLFGFLIGHWFFPRQSQWQFGWMWGIAFWVVLLAWDLWWPGGRVWYRYEGIWVLIGVACGTLFWGQIDKWSPIP